MPVKRQKVVILGCGNLAWHLAKRLSDIGRFDLLVFNHRANAELKRFSAKLKCKTSPSLKNIPGDADYYFTCVPDDSIGTTISNIIIKNPSAVLMHCSGSAPLSVLGARGHGTGVFYPLQTFTSGDELNWSEVPVILESRDTQALARMHLLASGFSTKVKSLTYEQRLLLHLCAVMVSNFPNALYGAAEGLLSEKGTDHLDFSLLMPLIRQTTAKLSRMEPQEAQTGPAKRGDKKVLKKHRELLKDNKNIDKIYRQLTKLIQRQQAGK
jgi:predicted short-subunit dehydrogenase-like oxidoreductase (DUF2520 family)